MTHIQKVDFYGDSIITQLDELGYPLVAIKPIVERLGIDWEGQRQRIKRDPLLSEDAFIIKVPTPGGPQDTTALPLNLVPGFLFGIDSSRIEDDEARETVLTYQRECHEVLFRHFFGSSSDMDTPVPDPSAQWDWQMIAAKMSLLRETRLTFGQSAARQMWAKLGLPEMVQEPASPSTANSDVEFVKAFISDQMEVDRTAMTSVQDAHEAYEKWAKMHGAPAMNMVSFGIYTSKLRIRKKKWGGGITHMSGLRLKDGGMTVQ